MPREPYNLRSRKKGESGQARVAHAAPTDTSIVGRMHSVYNRRGRRAIRDAELEGRKAVGFARQREWFPYTEAGLKRLLKLADGFPDLVARAMYIDVKTMLYEHVGNVVWPKVGDALAAHGFTMVWLKGASLPTTCPYKEFGCKESAAVVHAVWHGKIKVIRDAKPGERTFHAQDLGLSDVWWKKNVVELMNEKMEAAAMERDLRDKEMEAALGL